MDIVVTDFSSRGAIVKTGDILEGRYRIVRTLGTGSIGAVYLAEHLLIKRRVAIKILRPELGNAENLDGFMAEARATGTLGHPNIVECTDMGLTADGVPYIVLEYLEGAVLTDEIYRLGGLPVRRALRIADQIAAALGAAHEAGIVHRDLTSDNVFLVDRGESHDVAKVLDFGVSWFRTVPGERRQPGLAVGTLEFMAPEQLGSPDTVDCRTDVYALGVMLYEMLSARRPFTDDDRRSLLHRVLHEPPPPLMLMHVPVALEELIVGQMLAKDPARRPAGMTEVRAALEAFAAPLRPTAKASSELEAVQLPDLPILPVAPLEAALAAQSGVDALPVPTELIALTPPERRRTPQFAWLVAALLAGGAGAGTLYLDNQSRSAAEQAVATALDSDAEKLANLIDSEAHAARLRAEGVAAMPMLRAAIETDAATISDMVTSELSVSPRPGEVLELFQVRDEGAQSMLRLPANAPALSPPAGKQTRIVSDGHSVAIQVGAPVIRHSSGIGGAVALSVPVDLEPIRNRLAEHARSATLVGLGEPLSLVQTVVGGESLRVAVPLADLGAREVSLAVVPAPAAGGRSEMRLVRLGCWALGAMMLMLFTASLLRSGKPE